MVDHQKEERGGRCQEVEDFFTGIEGDQCGCKRRWYRSGP